MIVFSGFYSAIFFTFILGLIWPHHEKHSLSDAFLGYVGKALWLSWIIVLISYYTFVGEFLRIFILFSTILITYLCIYKYRTEVLVEVKKDLLLFILIFGFWFLLFSECWCESSYELIFNTWDAVVSWNRWAIELAGNIYKPYNAAYPILFPGIWSLVYEVQQDTTIWIMAKTTLFIFPISITIYGCLKFIEGHWLSASLFLLLGYELLISKFNTLTGGYMDYPVAAMLLLGLGSLVYVVDNSSNGRNQKSNGEALLFCAILISLACITKQAGSLGLIPLFFVFLKKICTKKLHNRQIITFILLLFTPILSFLIMFYMEENSIVGNIELLHTLSKTKAGEINIFFHTLTLLKSVISPWLMTLLLTLSAFNFFNYKEKSGQFGIVCLITTICGFFIYAFCASYSQRNGIWLFSFLVASAMSGATTFENHCWPNVLFVRQIKAKYLLVTTIFMGLLLALLLAINFNESEIRNAQLSRQEKLVNISIKSLLDRHKDELSPSARIISKNQLVGWLPEFIGRYQLYRKYHKYENLLNLTKKFPGSLVLVKKKQVQQLILFYDKSLILTFVDEEGAWVLLSSQMWKANNSQLRLTQLDDLKKALGKYFSKNGHYPRSVSYDGIKTKWGKSSKNWIPNLAPEFISELPRDPRMSDDGNVQYLYKSDGKDYKLLAHGIAPSTKAELQLQDPRRPTWAFGYWTTGALNW